MVRVVVVRMVEVVSWVVDSVSELLEDETGAVDPVVLGVVTG
jgi:hypothetical protein